MSRSRLSTFVAVLVLCAASVAQAGGPLLIFDASTQTPWAYGPSVDVYTDLGTLGAVTNAQADVLVGNTAAQWTGVPTSSFNAAVAGDFASIGLPDITAANANTVIGVNNGGGIHMIYDTDGLITQNVLGAPPGVLGIASPDFGSGGVLTESWVVLNGAAIEPADLPSAGSFAGVVTHEFGHSINLAHTQTNGGIIFFGDGRGPGTCPLPYTGGSLTLSQTETMYPFIDPTPGSTGVAQRTVTHLDDKTTLSDIYPAGGYPTGTATIEGTIYDTDGVTPLTGVNVIARNLNDAYADAVSALSGDFTQGALGADGRYRLTGLTPGGHYVVYVDEIVDGGFSTAPATLPGPEEWWNSAESNTDFSDPPCDYTAVSLAANQTVVLDIQMNGAGSPPSISVAPASFNFTVAPNGTDSAPLHISNTATAPAQDLDWNIVDVQPSIAAPLAKMLDASRFTLAKAPRVGLDSTDPEAARKCTDCTQSHADRAVRKLVDIDFVDASGAGNAIANPVTDPGFELGPSGGAWAEASTNFGTPICDTGTCGTGGGTGPRSGNFWCWFGGLPGGVETGSVSQSVVFPVVGQLSLEFYLEQPSCDSATDDMEVLIDGSVVFTVNGADASCGSAGYRLESVDVTAYADGASHSVLFRSTTVSVNGGASNFMLDDIALVEVLGPCPWLSAAPTNGLTAAGATDPITVSVDATGLAPGSYACQLEISSNDPLTPLVTVPVALQVQVPQQIYVTVGSSANGPVSVFSRPDGGGRPLTNALLWDGVVGNAPAAVDATIQVQLLDALGAPIPNFPPNLITVRSASGGWIECANTRLIADGPTDANGITTISGPLYAGGFSAPGELMEVVVNDPTVVSTIYPGGVPGLRYWVNSADIDKDLLSNLADVGTFATIFAGGGGDYEADYFWDGIINLVDIGELAAGLGSACPPPPPGIVAKAETREAASPRAEIGVYFDPAATQSARPAALGETLTAYVVARGEAVEDGLSAFAARLRVSDNVVITERENVGAAIDLGQDGDTVVGFAAARQATDDTGLVLMRVQLQVKDQQPAYFWIEPSQRFGAALPEVASQGKVELASPVSGAVDLAVASLNTGAAGGGTVALPKVLAMGIAPNPFNPKTSIRFSLPSSGPVELRIVDVRGKLVTVLRNEFFEAGEHVVSWNGTDRSGRTVSSGIYYSLLVTEGGSLTKKMMLVK